MAKASDNDFPSLLVTEQVSAPAAPAAGKRRIYFKDDGKFYHRNSGGTETEIGAAAATDGWVAGTGTWSYSSADDPTFVISINNDQTAILAVGQRIKLTQTSAKYFIVTAVGAYGGGVTLVTVYGGTDYDLANAAITTPYWSNVKAPFGFPVDPSKWTTTLSNTSDHTQASPVNGTWYNLGSLSISIPIGSWIVIIRGYVVSGRASSNNISAWSCLSTANNTASDTSLLDVISGVNTNIANHVIIDGNIIATEKTTYYLNHKVSDDSITAINLYGATVNKTIIRAVCAYL